jgi:hypothetical protein
MTYSPYRSAWAAVALEFSSPEAKAYFNFRAQQDSQMVLVALMKSACYTYEAAILAYQLGQFCRAWYESIQPQNCAIAPTSGSAQQIWAYLERQAVCQRESAEIVNSPSAIVLAQSAELATLKTFIDVEIIGVVKPHALLLPAAVKTAIAAPALLNKVWILNRISVLTESLTLPETASAKAVEEAIAAPANSSKSKKSSTPRKRKMVAAATVGQ